MGRSAHFKKAETLETDKTLGNPNKPAIVTKETLELLLNKLPEAARKAFRVPYIPHKLFAACKLVDAGCGSISINTVQKLSLKEKPYIKDGEINQPDSGDLA